MFFQYSYVLIWCSNGVSIVETMGKERRTSALSMMARVMQIGTLSAGVIHRLLIGIDLSLPIVFMICGSIGLFDGVAMILHPRNGRASAII